MVVSRLRRPSTSVGRSDQRPQGSAGAGWRAARRDERALPRMQHAQALGTDADAASTALTCSDGRDGLARPCSSPDGAALTKPNGVTALTGGDDVERAASNWGRIKSADLCGDLSRASTDERTTFAVLAQSRSRTMTEVDRGLALLHAHPAYVDRVLACRGCAGRLTRKPGRGRDPRWCSAVS